MWTKAKVNRKINLSLSFFMLSCFILANWGGGLTSQVIARAEMEDNENTTNQYFFIRLDEPTIAKGYTVSAFDDKLKLSLVPGILSEPTGVDIVELNEVMEMPWQLDKISQIYQFEFKNKAAYDNHKPFYIQFAYNKGTDNYKQVFFYDKNFGTWRPLPTKDFPEEMFVRSLIHLPFARIAVFDYPDILTVGRASWYKFKGGNYAASPDFPKGSRLRVHNMSNGKFVDVVVNDYGPDRKIHPDRVIDLDRIAFSKLADPRSGVINIKVEPLFVAPANNRILGVPKSGVNSEPRITLKSAIVMDEKNNNIFWAKNATSTLPLASLTKLVAIKVFLDTKPSLNRVVTYSERDEEYNYQYCQPWESAQLNMQEGETVTIEDLIYASLVGSANNTIETLVRVSGFSRNDFINKMNAMVASWGASSTHFIEPTGLGPENVSSSLDYAIITKEVFAHPIIAKASIMPEYQFSTFQPTQGSKTEKTHRIKNTNNLIKTNRFNITGSKTGYIDEAGYCLMTRVKVANGHNNIIVVTLGADTRDISFIETEELIRYGLRKVSN